MARYTGPKTKIARKLGEPIFGEDKYFAKKNYPPGQHGANRRRKMSEYGTQLREKQKAKYTYGVLERQFRNLFNKASRMKGVTGEVLLQLLEARLDNIVYRLGIAPTRAAARQLVLHRHITVDGKVVNIPSYSVSEGQIVAVREKSKSIEVIQDALAGFNHSKYPWIEWDESIKGGKVKFLSMAILAFQKPDKVLMLEADNSFGKFEFRPLEPGYGVTIGNALRRILLSGLEGFAICNIRIDGVQHEFATIKGVKEDVTNIILNLKKVRLKRIVEDTDTEKAVVKVSGQSVFKAGDIGKVLSAFEVLNPDLEICNIDPSCGFQIELSINKGRGYVPAEENKNANDPIDVIAIDSIYTPILNVKTTVENFRVEQKTDYEKLIIEITTDGSIHPKDALKGAAEILIQHFQLFTDREIVLDNTETNGNEEFDEEVLKMRQLLKTKLVDMDLSVRALNCLKSAEVETLGELVVFNKTDLLKFRNFGKKSLSELEELLATLNLHFGMDITKYKLEKE